MTRHDETQVRCVNGHLIRMWGSPLMAKLGSGVVNFWGIPLTCGECGARCSA